MHARRQTYQASTSLAFDVASIRPSKTTTAGVSISHDPRTGRFIGRNITLKVLIGAAFQVFDFQIRGGPGWIDSERYEVNATASYPTSADQNLRMVQAMLRDRFKLVFHAEDKEVSGLGLVVAKGGPKVRKASDDEIYRFQFRLPAGPLTARKAPISSLVTFLSRRLGRPIEDDTKLSDLYDFTLKWTPDESELDPEGMSVRVARDPFGPSLVTALQDQLGLRVEARKMSVHLFVVDTAERPAN